MGNAIAEDPTKDEQYKESAVDNMRQQKDKVLMDARRHYWLREHARGRGMGRDGRNDSFDKLASTSGVW